MRRRIEERTSEEWRRVANSYDRLQLPFESSSSKAEEKGVNSDEDSLFVARKGREAEGRKER